MNRLIRGKYLLLSALALTGACQSVFGATITYEFTVIASGSLNGAAFTNAFISFAGSGDPAVVSQTGSLASIRFAIPGTGSGIVAAPSIFVNQGNCTGNPHYPAIASCVGFGVSADILDIASNRLAGYLLTTATGPIVDPDPTGDLNQTNQTSAGDLIFASLSSGSFFSTFNTVPEPLTLGLLGFALVALALWRWTRRPAQSFMVEAGSEPAN